MTKLENRPQMTALAAKVMQNEVNRRKVTYRTGQWFKVSPEMVRMIRAAKGSNREIAAEFGITRQHISSIRQGKSRKSVK